VQYYNRIGLPFGVGKEPARGPETHVLLRLLSVLLFCSFRKLASWDTYKENCNQSGITKRVTKPLRRRVDLQLTCPKCRNDRSGICDETKNSTRSKLEIFHEYDGSRDRLSMRLTRPSYMMKDLNN
jgi:hypothetical protein